MGVPGFFVWLMKHNIHDNIILKQLQNIDNLYFDANCLFHPKCFDILKLHSDITDTIKLEELMIKRILKYIQYIIDFVNPSKTIYIAVDGVAPIAKINQQRKRRYKSVIDTEYTEKMNKKYNINKSTVWSNIVITPGTEFMKKLDLAIKIYFKGNKKIIYSSYEECGEGEHKIIRYIKEHAKNKRNVIYGLDADLIFLSMSAHSHESEIYLLRELQHLKKTSQPITEDVSEPLCYLSIQNTIDTYNEYILNRLKENEDFLEMDLSKKYDFSKDFIILCFMLGNDFIPNLPSINIRINGIEYITEAYCKMFEYLQKYIYNDGKINWDSLRMIYDYIGSNEDEYFSDVLIDYKKRIKNKRCNANNNYEKEIWEHENLKDINLVDNVKLGFGDKIEYKFRYYEYNFNSRINQQNMINKVCKNYLEMIEWITKYYFNIEMPSWQYCYYFHNSPFASDLYSYLNQNKIEYNIDYKESIKIETQLLAVIPSYYSHILKECKVDIKKFKDIKYKYMFPTEYELEYDNKDLYWMCEAKLPMVDFNF
jgi:5'-3' exonuclease